MKIYSKVFDVLFLFDKHFNISKQLFLSFQPLGNDMGWFITNVHISIRFPRKFKTVFDKVCPSRIINSPNCQTWGRTSISYGTLTQKKTHSQGYSHKKLFVSHLLFVNFKNP